MVVQTPTTFVITVLLEDAKGFVVVVITVWLEEEEGKIVIKTCFQRIPCSLPPFDEFGVVSRLGLVGKNLGEGRGNVRVIGHDNPSSTLLIYLGNRAKLIPLKSFPSS
jgi:hypothetical protein